MKGAAMNPQYAEIRRILMVFGIFNLIPFIIILMLGGWGNMVLAGFLINASVLLWLVIDVAVTIRLLRQAGLLDDPMSYEEVQAAVRKGGVGTMFRAAFSRSMKDSGQAEKILWLFFNQGVTWKYLKSVIRQMEEMPLEIERAERERRDQLKALGEKKVAEEQQLREARRAREVAELLQKGMALGIPEGDIRLCLAEGLAKARTLIAQKEREKALLERASAASCGTFIEKLLQRGEFDEAEAYVVQAKALLEQAVALELEKSVRQHLANRSLEGARLEVVEETKRRELAVLKAGFIARIEKLPRARQPEAQRMLSELAGGGIRHGTREFRIKEHALHQYLTR